MSSSSSKSEAADLKPSCYITWKLDCLCCSEVALDERNLLFLSRHSQEKSWNFSSGTNVTVPGQFISFYFNFAFYSYSQYLFFTSLQIRDSCIHEVSFFKSFPSSFTPCPSLYNKYSHPVFLGHSWQAVRDLAQWVLFLGCLSVPVYILIPSSFTFISLPAAFHCKTGSVILQH